MTMAAVPLNSSLLGQNNHHLADGIFIFIFIDDKFCVLVELSVKFLPNGPIDNDSALV